MDCDTAQEILLDAEDGATRAAEGGAAAINANASAARAHVESCNSCRAALADLRRLRRAMRTFNSAAEPANGGWDAFTERLVASIGRAAEEESDSRASVARRWAGDAALLKSPGRGARPSRALRGFAAAAAACVLAGGIGFGVGRQGGDSTPNRVAVHPAVGATTS